MAAPFVHDHTCFGINEKPNHGLLGLEKAHYWHLGLHSTSNYASEIPTFLVEVSKTHTGRQGELQSQGHNTLLSQTRQRQHKKPGPCEWNDLGEPGYISEHILLQYCIYGRAIYCSRYIIHREKTFYVVYI